MARTITTAVCPVPLGIHSVQRILWDDIITRISKDGTIAVLGACRSTEVIEQLVHGERPLATYSRMEEFRRLEREAREQGRGLWATNP
jgi:hypothetical protein